MKLLNLLRRWLTYTLNATPNEDIPIEIKIKLLNYYSQRVADLEAEQRLKDSFKTSYEIDQQEK